MKILVIDDHPLFRDGLRLILKHMDADIEVSEATDFQEALEMLSTAIDLDLVLLDLRLPGMNGLEGIATIRDRAPEIPVIVVSAVEERGTVMKAFQRGAMGYIPKSAKSEVILNAIKLVMAGGKYLPPIVAGGTQPDIAMEPLDDTQPPSSADLAKLTRRQRDVLALLGQGNSNREIADILGLAEGTVKIHVSAILKVLKASNRTQAAMAAAKMNLVPGSTESNVA